VAFFQRARGNLRSDGNKTYTFTQDSKLITVTASGLSWSAAYNGDGVRTRQTISGTANRYVQDLAAPLPVVLSDTNAIYVYGLGDSPLAQYANGKWTYLSGRDGLNSVRQEMDTNSYILTTRNFDRVHAKVVRENGFLVGSGQSAPLPEVHHGVCS
jgi:hypothetical protein